MNKQKLERHPVESRQKCLNSEKMTFSERSGKTSFFHVATYLLLSYWLIIQLIDHSVCLLLLFLLVLAESQGKDVLVLRVQLGDARSVRGKLALLVVKWRPGWIESLRHIEFGSESRVVYLVLAKAGSYFMILSLRALVFWCSFWYSEVL